MAARATANQACIRNKRTQMPAGPQVATLVPPPTSRHSRVLQRLPDALDFVKQPGHNLHPPGVKMFTGLLENERLRLFGAPALFVGAGTAQGIIDVTQGDDTRRDGNVLPLQARGVATAIPLFMVIEGNLRGQLQQR